MIEMRIPCTYVLQYSDYKSQEEVYNGMLPLIIKQNDLAM